MRVALHSVIRRGHGPDYDAEHRSIPEDLVDSFGRVGIREWTIWRSGDHLFHLVETDDFAAAMRALEDDPANMAWQKHIGRHVDHFELVGDAPEGMPLPHVWSLADQRR